jgi:hypothetical protein
METSIYIVCALAHIETQRVKRKNEAFGRAFWSTPCFRPPACHTFRRKEANLTEMVLYQLAGLTCARLASLFVK